MTKISLSTQKLPTFTEIETTFRKKKGGADHHIRALDGERLYTSSNASMAKIKAHFGFPKQLEDRKKKQESGVEAIKRAIDREYGKGVADKVMTRLQMAGVYMSQGMKQSDLTLVRVALDQINGHRLREAIDIKYGDGMGELVFQHLRNKARDPLDLMHREDERGRVIYEAVRQIQSEAALKDEDRGIEHKMYSDKFIDWMRRHFEICSSEEFWEDGGARASVDIIGSTMCLVVLERINDKGFVTQKDRNDLQRALDPFHEDESSFANFEDIVGEQDTGAAPDIPNDFLGPLADDKLKMLTSFVFDRYFFYKGAHALNVTIDPELYKTFGKAGRPETDRFGNGISASVEPPTSTGRERLEALRAAHRSALSSVAMRTESLTNGLNAIKNGGK